MESWSLENFSDTARVGDTLRNRNWVVTPLVLSELPGPHQRAWTVFAATDWCSDPQGLVKPKAVFKNDFLGMQKHKVKTFWDKL